MSDRQVRIKVIGVGGGGGNAINNMIQNCNADVEFIAVNTDSQALNGSEAKTENRILIGDKKDKGLGAGSKPEVGEASAIASLDELSEKIKGADMVFVAAGLGGGTGTGAAPVITKLAKDMGALTVAIVTKPFSFEGKKRADNARVGIQKLKETTDSLIEISNDKVINNSQKRTTLKEAFQNVDNVLRKSVSGVFELITNPGYINLDFADIRTILKDSGRAVMGVGEYQSGDSDANAVIEATKLAINSPLLDSSIDGARRVMLNFTSKDEIGILEINEAAEMIQELVNQDANIIFGTTVDNELEDGYVKVTVIATDFEDSESANVPIIADDAANENIVRPSYDGFPRRKDVSIPSFSKLNANR